MSLISLFFHGEYQQLILSSVALLITFYALGRIAQGYFRFHKSNILISIPLGLIIFLFINQLVYTPIIITDLGMSTLAVIDTLKAIIILIFIAVSYEQWIPKFSFIGIKSLAYMIVVTSAVIVLYLFLLNNFDDFAIVDEQWVYQIYMIKENNFYGIENTTDDIYNILSGYQSTYYWIYLNSAFAVGEEITTETIEKVVRVHVAIVWIATVSLAIQSSFVSNEKTFVSNIIAGGLSVIAMFSLGMISPTSDLFYTLSLSFIVSMILFDYAKRKQPTEIIIYVALLSTTAFTTVGASPLAYLMMFGFLAVLLSIIRGGNIINNSISYMTIVIVVITYYIFAMIIHDLENIANILFYLVLIGVLLMLILLPLYSLGFTQSRREELVKAERRMNKKIGKTIIISTLVTTLFALFLNFINEIKTIDLLINFFIEFSMFEANAYVGLTQYLIMVVLPMILITFFYNINKRNDLLSAFIFVNLFLNPIVISTFCNTLSIVFTGDIILVPSVLLLILFLLNEIQRRIPYLH